jgi:hypothetical protein
MDNSQIAPRSPHFLNLTSHFLPTSQRVILSEGAQRRSRRSRSHLIRDPAQCGALPLVQSSRGPPKRPRDFRCSEDASRRCQNGERRPLACRVRRPAERLRTPLGPQRLHVTSLASQSRARGTKSKAPQAARRAEADADVNPWGPWGQRRRHIRVERERSASGRPEGHRRARCQSVGRRWLKPRFRSVRVSQWLPSGETPPARSRRCVAFSYRA